MTSQVMRRIVAAGGEPGPIGFSDTSGCEFPADPPDEMAVVDERHEKLCSESRWDFSDLRAIYLGCSLPGSEPSHTDGLFDIVRAVMERNGVTVEIARALTGGG